MDMQEYINRAKRELRVSSRYANGIDYLFVYEADGWISIIERTLGGYEACLQAKDEEHALSYIAMREPLTVPAQKLV